MSRFHRLRNSLHFRHWFDAVHPLFWPVLYWSLSRMFRWMGEENLSSVLFEITWWGGIRICILGDKIETPKPNPLAPTRPRWDDPVWASDVPAILSDLAAHETRRRLPILPRAAGGGCEGSAIALQSPGAGLRSLWRSRLTEAALTSPLNTS